MRSFLVVMFDVFPEDSAKVAFAQDKDIIQTLPEGYIYSDSRYSSVILVDQSAESGNTNYFAVRVLRRFRSALRDWRSPAVAALRGYWLRHHHTMVGVITMNGW